MTSPAVRRGSSLVEMLGAMSVGALLLSLAATVIVLMLRWDSTVLRRTAEEHSRRQLAIALRSDAREAAERPRVPAPGAPELTLDVGRGRTVEYRCRPGWVERSVRTPQGVETAEQFRLAPSAAAQFHLEEEHQRHFLRLEVREPAQGRATARSYELWAVLPRPRSATTAGEQP